LELFARRRRFYTEAFAASLLVVLGVVACSGNGYGDAQRTVQATVTPTAASRNPGAISPPSGYLKDSAGNAVEGGTGTYCWRQADVQMCRDFFGVRTNRSPIPVRPGEDAEFVFDAGTPREVRLHWTPADELMS
jgi:hypothetical protein